MSPFKLFHLIIILSESMLLYVSSNLGIGSPERNQEIVSEEFIQFLIARVIFNAIIFLIPLLIVFFINRIFLKRGVEKKLINRSYLIHFFIFFILTGFFVGFSIFKFL